MGGYCVECEAAEIAFRCRVAEAEEGCIQNNCLKPYMKPVLETIHEASSEI